LARLPKDIWLVLAGPQAPAKIFRALDLPDLPPRVHLAGFVAENSLPALYSGALALVYVSIYEGFGLPALEAMASGTVPIVGDNTSLPEVVGDAGIQVNPYEIDAIASALERVIGDSELRETLGARAVRRSQQFSWEQTASLTWEVLSAAMTS
jgi:glycosyltransferase involved in cell wall biosynthesis